MLLKTPHFTLNTRTLKVMDSKGKEVKIYNKDYEVLLFLCKQDRAQSTVEILENVWDRNSDFTSNVVASSIANIRRHLGKPAISTIRNCYIVEDVKEIEEKSFLNIFTSIFSQPWKKTVAILSIIFLSLFFGYNAYSYIFLPNSIIVSNTQIDSDRNDNTNLENEWIELKNTTESNINLKNWEVSDSAGHTFIFYKTTILEPSQKLKLVTGVCENTKEKICWNRTKFAVWNNDSDTIYIRNHQKKLISRFSYNQTP